MQPIFHAQLGKYQEKVNQALDDISANRIIERLWAHDHTVWKPDHAEITNRLGWLTIASDMQEHVGDIRAFAASVQQAGYDHALLLGMGGSSLAPELFRKVFGVAKGHLDLSVLDSTDPGAVLYFARTLNPAKTLIIVATKSGGTVETLSEFKYFYNWIIEAVSKDRAGEHFIAITDPGSSLVDLANRHQFRHVFLNDPNIGGRYSALSHFGLVPAGLLGVDLDRLLNHALAMGDQCGDEVAAEDNPGAWLGAALAELAKVGRDKLTFVLSAQIASFGDWVEQLIAESTGKEGKGILPVAGEALGTPDHYSEDRVFVSIARHADTSHQAQMEALARAGHPTLSTEITDLTDLGGQFLLWEIATAVAGYRLGINPFDQPNVEAAKVLAREVVAAYAKTGSLPQEPPILKKDDVAVYGSPGLSSAGTPAQALQAFLIQAQPGAYIALQAYSQTTPETDRALNQLRLKLRDTTKLATTSNYGPRFLHSTGQLHKGDAGRGLFIQFTGRDAEDVPIPDEAGSKASGMTFGVLKLAQALGDAKALTNGDRRMIRFDLGENIAEGLIGLANSI